MNTYLKIKKLHLHEEVKIRDSDYTIMRVLGGVIYRNYKEIIFVPFGFFENSDSSY